ncbi:hypothetical protein SAMN05444166_1740 [Singulisphaera sp. GP187]|nr:hypothetical protein SAMN05444166_1740 [Singulisphaera sp. GP187]
MSKRNAYSKKQIIRDHHGFKRNDGFQSNRSNRETIRGSLRSPEIPVATVHLSPNKFILNEIVCKGKRKVFEKNGNQRSVRVGMGAPSIGMQRSPGLTS